MNSRLLGRALLTLVIFTAMLIVRLTLTSGMLERLVAVGGRWLGWGITGGFLQLPADRAERLGIALLLFLGLAIGVHWLMRHTSALSDEPRGRRFVDPNQLRRDRPSRHYL